LNSQLELVMAHELLHNCGAWMHDNQIIKTNEIAIKMMRPNWNGTCLVGSLMNSHVTNYKGSYIISECAKDQMLFHLFNKTRKLIDKHQCLVIENNLNKQKNLKKYIDKAKNERPGYYYSLADQCRMITFNQSKFAVRFESCSGYVFLFSY